MRILITLFIFINLVVVSKITAAETIKIEFTEDDSYSIEVAFIDVGDTIEWFPKNEGHNVEFLVGPNMNALPHNSKMNESHSVLFKTPGIYLYGCTPHLNMGMLGLIIVGKDFHNLEKVNKVELSFVANSVLGRLIKTAQSN
ncbi:plastocyanin/azurin family copper-binding protein [Candidatus Thioglobus sp. NP1]|uniref:plastocyanin/azurin family copper-binding protein n=1 Tax=Candidatus Thioglobus sp. NP1 TaxID=2508687 RepID=UPI000DEDD45D|nr:plastocyanin/azurin family copper-binding protein [Candidatus Thioglobus sp. NP1]AXE61301.1 pseudoazurin [Candidatus Thioglobus sp. NP1]